MKKRILSMLLAGAMVFGLAACGGKDPAPQGSEPAGSTPPGTEEPSAGIAKEDLKIGFVHIGDESDMGYTYNMVQGVREMQKNLDIPDDQIVTKYNVTEDDACADALNELMDAGCNIIFATSFGFGDYVTAAARENPDIQFCHATGTQAHSENLPNLHNCFASIYEGRYLAGIAAGMKAKEIGNPKLGYVGAYPYAEVISGYTSFYLGAKSVYPDVTMDVIYTNTWNNASLESQTAQALIDRGCGVISQHSDSTGPATTAEMNGAFQVGYNADMTEAAPGASLLSTRIDWGIYFTEAVQAMLDGTEIPLDWCKGYADGAVTMTPLNEAIAAEGTKEAIEAAEAELKAGTLEVFQGEVKGVNGNGDEVDLSTAFHESDVAGGKTSAPYFDYIVDGITVVSDQ